MKEAMESTQKQDANNCRQQQKKAARSEWTSDSASRDVQCNF